MWGKEGAKKEESGDTSAVLWEADEADHAPGKIIEEGKPMKAFHGSSEILVKARPEQVWAILEDSTRLPDWAPMIKGTTGKIEKVGSLRTCQVEWEGRKDEVVERCIEATPPKKILWVMEKGGMKKLFSDIRFGFALEPKDGDITLLRLEFLYEPKNIIAYLMYILMMKRKLKDLRQTLLNNLKELAENRGLKHEG